MRTRLVIELALAACLSLRPATAAAQVATASQGTPGTKCAALSGLQVPGVALAITKADAVAAGPAARGRGATVNLPRTLPRRRHDRSSRRRGRARLYGIGFAIALPDAWNGRFLFQGGGGLNGTVGLPLGAQAAGDSAALVRGFAVVSTDTGHQASAARSTRRSCAISRRCWTSNTSPLDVSPSSRRRLSLATTAGPREHSYFAGCSTGGREAMLDGAAVSRRISTVSSPAPRRCAPDTPAWATGGWPRC